MTRPLIGITTYGRDGKDGFSLPAEYVDALRRAGATPFLLPPGEPEPQAVLELVEGMVIAGGGDIEPARYGGDRHETVYKVDAERDEWELAVARWILERGMPTLAICRGLQVLNVALGGSLYEHLPDVVGEAVAHRLPPREPVPHRVEILPGSLLAEVLGRLEIEAASWHHQGVKEVAAGLKVVARATDGVIEALEMPDHPWLLAVQWHPELTAGDDPAQQRLFDALVEASAMAGRGARDRPEEE